MKDVLTVSGLVVNILGCGILYLESARISARIPSGGLVISEEDGGSDERDGLRSWFGRLGFLMLGIGNALQILAIYSA